MVRNDLIRTFFSDWQSIDISKPHEPCRYFGLRTAVSTTWIAHFVKTNTLFVCPYPESNATNVSSLPEGIGGGGEREKTKSVKGNSHRTWCVEGGKLKLYIPIPETRYYATRERQFRRDFSALLRRKTKKSWLSTPSRDGFRGQNVFWSFHTFHNARTAGCMCDGMTRARCILLPPTVWLAITSDRSYTF